MAYISLGLHLTGSTFKHRVCHYAYNKKARHQDLWYNNKKHTVTSIKKNKNIKIFVPDQLKDKEEGIEYTLLDKINQYWSDNNIDNLFKKIKKKVMNNFANNTICALKHNTIPVLNKIENPELKIKGILATVASPITKSFSDKDFRLKILDYIAIKLKKCLTKREFNHIKFKKEYYKGFVVRLSEGVMKLYFVFNNKMSDNIIKKIQEVVRSSLEYYFTKEKYINKKCVTVHTYQPHSYVDITKEKERSWFEITESNEQINYYERLNQYKVLECVFDK